jgi:glucose-1-phosphate cytidylyltransferase
VKVVILCGGLGTRLREETEFRPKPMVEVGGRPILWHIMKTYAHHGFREFVLCLGYRGNSIKEYFLNYEAMNNDFSISLGEKSQIHFHGSHAEQEFSVTLADTGVDCMTGGRIHKIQRYLDGDAFLMTYGDGLTDVDIGDVVKYHHSHGRIATVTTVSPSSPKTAASRVTTRNPRPMAGLTPATSCSTPGSSTISAATTASSSASPWGGWRATAS